MKIVDVQVHVLKSALAPGALQWAYHVSIRFMGGDYEGVVEAAEAAGPFSYVPGLHAAALAHLGRVAGGRKVLERWKKQVRGRWAGVHAPADEDLFRWLLSAIPLKREEDWLRYQRGLAALDAPVQGLAHNAW